MSAHAHPIGQVGRRLRGLLPALGLVVVLALGFLLGLAGRRFVADRPRREVARLLAGTAGEAVQGGRVLFVFHAVDCAASLDIIETWNALHRRHPGSVVGLMVGTRRSVPDWEAIAAASGITFPVRLIPPPAAAELLRRAGQSSTPVSIVIGGDERLRAALAGSGSEGALERAVLINLRP
jgi:hypothetical protein